MTGNRDGPPAGPRLVGSRAGLDFANTVEWRTSGAPVESLATYRDLIGWAAKEGIVAEARAQGLLREAERRPDEAAAALARAIALREAIYRILARIGQGAPAEPGDLAALNAALAGSLARLRLVSDEASGRFAWELADVGDDLDGVLWPIALSAAELLTSDELPRVRACEGEGCGWLFVDTSRNQSRRWCSMESCGNRAKAKRHYARMKQGAHGAEHG